MINIGGLKVYPIEIEEVINRMEGVKESAVIQSEENERPVVKAFIIKEILLCIDEFNRPYFIDK